MGTVISAKVIADSINTQTGDRLTTVLATFPRMILAEVNTHRKLSGNTSSSRAIPVKKMIEAVANDPFAPVVWTKNEPGMQGYETLEGLDLHLAKAAWYNAARDAVAHAHTLSTRGAHKQIVNRLLEPFMWTVKLMSATEWGNFFRQRCHSAAEPHMQILAKAIRDQIDNSEITYLRPGEWHIPFDPGTDYSMPDRLKIATARAAHTSYTLVDGLPLDAERAITVYEKIVSANPMHASPLEHCAKAQFASTPFLSRNFDGFSQLRAYLESGRTVESLFPPAE